MKPSEYAVIRVAAGRNPVLRVAVLPRLRQKRRVERRSHPVLIEIGPKIDVPSNTVYVICSRSMKMLGMLRGKRSAHFAK